MATMAENLAAIMEARYGRDVRQSIHDGIQQTYTDGIASNAAANAAALNANAKAVIADNATGSANIAASNANTKAGLANTAALNADAKAGLANTAALNADAKAALATTATGLANAAALNADAKASLADTKATLANTAANRVDAAILANDTAAANANTKADLANTKAGLADTAAINANAKAALADTATGLANTAALAANNSVINDASFIGDNLVFNQVGGKTTSVLNARNTLKGDKGDKGDIGNIGPKGELGNTGPGISSAMFDSNDIKFVREDAATFVLPNAKITLKGDKGDTGNQGNTGNVGNTGPSVVSAEFLNDDIRFTRSDAQTFLLNNAKNELKGDVGPQGEVGPAGEYNIYNQDEEPTVPTGEEALWIDTDEFAPPISAANIAFTDSTGRLGATTVQEAIKEILLAVHRVGKVILTLEPDNPGTYYGGVWESLGSRFLIGADGSYPVGATGGEATHKHNLGDSGWAKIGKVVNGMLHYKMVSIPLVSQNRVISITNSSTGGEVNLPEGIGLGGETISTTIMPPYLSVYMWKRVS